MILSFFGSPTFQVVTSLPTVTFNYACQVLPFKGIFRHITLQITTSLSKATEWAFSFKIASAIFVLWFDPTNLFLIIKLSLWEQFVFIYILSEMSISAWHFDNWPFTQRKVMRSKMMWQVKKSWRRRTTLNILCFLLQKVCKWGLLSNKKWFRVKNIYIISTEWSDFAFLLFLKYFIIKCVHG